MPFRMIVEGRPLTTRRTLPVVDPATEEVVGFAPDCSADQLDQAVSAARGSFQSWARRSRNDRRAHLHDCGAVLAANQDEIAALVTAEQGKPLDQARAETALSASWFADTARMDLADESLVDDAEAHVLMRRVPHGVVAAITPFNFPIVLSVCKIAPALLAGNTVVVKPSPTTPLSTLRMVELLNEVLPPGVLNVVTGGAQLGPALAGHPMVALVSFTGSVHVGREIARSAGAALRPVVLELGGNDPAIVMPGTELTDVADELFTRSMVNSGQYCAAIKRIYVSEPQRADLVDLLAERAERAGMGDGRDPRSQYGPLTGRAQLDRVTAFVREAVAAGGRCAAGGHPLARPGFFHSATVVTDLPPGTRLETEEQFGPVVPVFGYADLGEAVAAANATEYGLGASIWGEAALARSLATAVEAGTVWVNTHGELRHDVPFGGVKSSGLGVEYGYWGLLEYTRVNVIHDARQQWTRR